MKDTVDPQELIIEYVSILENVEYLPNTIKVEISARSIKEATEIRDVNSITEGLLPKIELLGGLFQVRAIEPQITLLEKICLLHEEFTKPISAMRHLRMSRHLYDLSKLSDSIYADIAIQNDALFDRIVTHRKRYIRQTGIDYSNLDKQNLSFIPPSHIIENYKTDYEKMKLNMIYGKAPLFQELISKLVALQAAIR